MNLTELAQEKPGSTASTNAKAALGMKLTVWFCIIAGIGFLYCVVVPGKDALADNILWAVAVFLGGFLGFNVVQRKFDRDSDWGLKEREKGYPIDGRMPGAPGAVTKEVVKTVSTETASRETTAPAAPAPDPAAASAAEPDGAWPDGRTGIL